MGVKIASIDTSTPNKAGIKFDDEQLSSSENDGPQSRITLIMKVHSNCRDFVTAEKLWQVGKQCTQD